MFAEPKAERLFGYYLTISPCKKSPRCLNHAKDYVERRDGYERDHSD